jgi:hypothetical protein
MDFFYPFPFTLYTLFILEAISMLKPFTAKIQTTPNKSEKGKV